MSATPQPIVFLGADHGGFELKEKVAQFLTDGGYIVRDMGASTYDPTDDYPQYAFAVSEAVAAAAPGTAYGILFCRSGGGMVIAANKVRGTRAVAVADMRALEHAITNNNANIIALEADWTSERAALQLAKQALLLTFPQEHRHQRRIAQITQYETDHHLA